MRYKKGENYLGWQAAQRIYPSKKFVKKEKERFDKKK